MGTLNSPRTPLLAVLGAVLLLVAACGDDAGDEATDEATPTETTAGDDAPTTTVAGGPAPSESEGAGLLAEVTGLLHEQVFLTGALVDEAAAAGGDADAPGAVSMEEAAMAGATELSEVLGAAYGVVNAVDFLDAWNDHRQAVVDVALAGGSPGDVESAREAVVDVLAEIDPDAATDEVAAGLEATDAALLSAVTDIVSGAPAAAAELRAAAGEVMPAARALAGVVAEQRGLEEELEPPEVELRAELTALLQESALLTGLALGDAVQPGATGPGVADAIEENTEALAEAMDLGGATSRFTQIWNGHIEAFEDHLAARRAGDAGALDASRAAIVEFRDDVGELLAERHPAFTMESVAEELVPHTDSILALADALAEGPAGQEDEADDAEGPTQGELLRESAAAMRLAARTLTGGLTAPSS